MTGQSPAVLTETIWALAHEKPAIIPHQVVAVTTTQGRDTLIRELLSPPENCVWDQLSHRLEELGHDLTHRLRFGQTPHDIRVFTIFDPQSKRTRELPDIGSEEENMAAADFIMETVRGLAMDDDVRLVASVAGGRKTMSALLFAVMSLLAKEDDLLTHVLVNDPFESRGLKPRFYFPPAQPLMHSGTDRDGNPISVSSASARIQLGKIPFVALRNLFERDLKRRQSYSQLVRTCQRHVQDFARKNIRLAIRRSRREIRVNGRAVTLSALQHLLLLYLAENAVAGKPAPEKFTVAIEPLAHFAEALRKCCVASDGNDLRDEARLPKDFDDQRLRKVLDELKTKLRSTGVEAAALIPLLPVKGRFSLDLAPSAIDLRD
ncbi:MAG: CRISPR-associated ring nuclease Csm6 [Candidatus Omnitrophica bacterium]|nr:CRISPR-associated ring nuclease Csm6 [Candidatus Omnitrophota bacterium]